MFEQDYFMRMIMQVTHYISRIIRLRQEQKPEQGQLLLGQGYEFFFGLSADMVAAMSSADLLKWFKESGRDHEQVNRAFLEYLQTHIELLEELESDKGTETETDAETDMFAETGTVTDSTITKDERVSESSIWLLKKVDFYLYLVVDEGEHTLLDLAERMETDLHRLLVYEVPVDCYRRLFSYRELCGDFARAEDALYDWSTAARADSEDDSSDDSALKVVLHTGDAFYERLLALSDEQLDAGGLPRDEVQFGREQWLTQSREPA